MKKLRSIGSLAFVLVLLLSACAPATPAVPATTAPVAQPTTAPAQPQPTTAPGQTQPTAAPAATQASAPASDIVLGVAAAGSSTTTFTKNFNIFSTSYLFPTSNGIYEPMMVNNRIKGELVPWLATAYKWSDDLKTLTFTIRDGVKWSDNQPFAASDIAYTFNLLKSNAALQGAGQQAVGKGGYVDTVTAPDAKTVVFTFNRVYTPGFYDIVQQNIVPEHIWKDVSDPVKFINEKPVGTGPFTELVSFQDQVYEVDRNPYYWQPGKANIKGFRMPAFSGNDTAANLLINGNVEWTGQFFANVDQAVLAKNKDVHCWWPAVTSDQLFMVNTTKKPFDDVVVRKAISMAFDRKQVIQIALQGKSQPADVTALSSGYAAWKVSDPTALGSWTNYDPAKANADLDAAGYKKGSDGFRTQKDGTPMQFELLMVNGFSDWLAVAPLLKQNLTTIGLNVNIQNYDVPVAFDKWRKGTFDMSLFFGIDADTPYVYYRNIMATETLKPVGTDTALGWNMWRYSNKDADAALLKFATTNDQAQQKQAAADLQKIFADNAPVIPMFHAPTFFCYSDKRVTGWANEQNPFTRAMPIGNNATPEQLLQMVALQPK